MHHRNTTLDWLRCVAIVAVVNCHASALAGPGTNQLFGIGGRGVDLFFVLSGWLLGHQLLKSLRATGTIDVRRFWLRRWLRTLPAYYAMLAFSVLWQAARNPDWHFDWRYLVFVQTYGPPMPYFAVSWSLCVEEHFYLAVAPLLLLLRDRAGAALLVALLGLPQVLRWVYPDFNWEQTQFRYDQCATGVLLAYWAVYWPRWWGVLCKAAPVLAAAGVAGVGYGLTLRATGSAENDLSVAAWAGIAGSWVLLANSSEFWRSKTGWAPARFVAERAYSLYLTHVEALAVVRKVRDAADGLPFAVTLALTWLLALAAAEVLYRTVERPVMRSRERLAAARQTGP